MKFGKGKATDRIQQLFHKQYNSNEIRITVGYTESNESKNKDK